MKKIVSALLAGVLLTTSTVPALAASDEAVKAANELYSQGLFNGTGNDANGNPNFELDRAPTRAEAVTMLVRLLGKDDEAKNGSWNTPFTDVEDWAKPYVGYAYTNKLTVGTSATTFGDAEKISASQYITFVLRALGYESGKDFQWDKAWELSDKIGLTGGNFDSSTKSFVRGDVAQISLNALNAPLKNSSETLASTLNIEVPAIDVASQIYGYWSGVNITNDAEFIEIYHFDNGKYSCSYMVSDKSDNLLWTGYDEGTYSVSSNALTLKRSTEYVLMANASSCNISEQSETFSYTLRSDTLNTLAMNNWIYKRQMNSRDAYDRLKEKVISTDNRPKSSDYTYLVDKDFRSIRSKYSSAVANYGYTYAYQNTKGEKCVLTLVNYKIINNYMQFTLHNMSTGQTITNPAEYYQKEAKRAYGAKALDYIDMATDVMEIQVKMLQAAANVMQGKNDTLNGVFVNASTLNK